MDQNVSHTETIEKIKKEADKIKKGWRSLNSNIKKIKEGPSVNKEMANQL